jgi:hypothetical protein
MNEQSTPLASFDDSSMKGGLYLDVPVGGPKELFTACSPDLAIGSRDGDHLVDDLGSFGGGVHGEQCIWIAKSCRLDVHSGRL